MPREVEPMCLNCKRPSRLADDQDTVLSFDLFGLIWIFLDNFPGG